MTRALRLELRNGKRELGEKRLRVIDVGKGLSTRYVLKSPSK